MKKILFASFFIASLTLSNHAQTEKSAVKLPDYPIVFAVIRSGGTLEPIGYLDEEKKLVAAVDGGSEADVLKAFHGRYFKPKASYQLVFGGANAGTVTVKSSDPNAECSRHTAEVIVNSTRAKLKGSVMALAVESSFKLKGSGTRRAPTALERAEIDSLVKAEFSKHKISAAVLRKLQNRNLTAVDYNGDDIVEFVGSYWVAPTPKTRSLLFFVAEQDIDSTYHFTFSDFGTIKEEDTMSSDITTIDTGIGHEMLLDLLDLDGDGASEIFTYEASFEGDGFNAYRREGGKWVKVFDGANYRCGF